MSGVLRFVFVLTLTVYSNVCLPQEIIPLKMLSRHCIKIWRMMSDLVEQKKRPLLKNIDDKVYNDFLDEIICALVRARDMIAQVQKQQQIDLAAAEYVASSLDCIESYSYDLIQYYPGGWSTVIQDQVIRTQEAYAQEIVPLITR